MYSESSCETETFPPLLLTRQCKKKEELMLVILWTFSDLQSGGIDSCWLQSRVEICTNDQADMA